MLNDHETFVGDFETTTRYRDRTAVWLYGFSNLDKTIRCIGINLFDFIRDCEKYKVRKMYFHNLSFDGKFITHFLLNTGYRFTTNQRLKSKEFTWLCDNRKNMYSLTVKLKTHTITFLDSAKLLQSSVSNLGKSLNYPKLDIDYDSYDEVEQLTEIGDKEKEYLWRDIDIVIEAMIRFRYDYPNHTMTSAGTAMKSFKEVYGAWNYFQDFGGKYKNEIRNLITREQWDQFHLGYKGGFNVGKEIIRNKKICLLGTYYDYNSLYPYIMRDYLLPYGRPLDRPPDTSYMKVMKVLIMHTSKRDPDMPAHLRNPDAFYQSKEKYLNQAENITVIYTDFEWQELQLTYDLIEGVNYIVLKQWYFKTKYVFRDWVKKMQHFKENAKDECERLCHKIVLNACYGKTGQRYSRDDLILKYDPDKHETGLRYGLDDEWVEVGITTKSEVLSPVILAVAISAHARTKMVRLIRKNKKHFLYCDTDSIAVEGELTDEPFDNDKFGFLKQEYKFKAFKWIKPKSYMFETTHQWNKKTNNWEELHTLKRALGGLHKERHHLINFDNFYAGYQVPQGNRQKRQVKGGVILVDTLYTL